ncbi:hypothetical protein AGMMS49959_00080 [Planctomycetales bacterium]|nr:hypothetical protein AGMMS49959_00080 [Planctomycetales bacterium]
MATTHVFIVDANTFKYHLEYLFVGTGAKDEIIDFNNCATTNMHATKENNLLGMIADSQRLRSGDFVIFYLQQNFAEGIREGKFYGVFKIKHAPAFLDNNDSQQFLKEQLGKSLTFRASIEPLQVYSEGVTEWEALDEIRNIQSPNQMLWSLIYRKLKGNRGNTMITFYESERLNSLIRNKNHEKTLKNAGFSFDKDKQQIIESVATKEYTGRKTTINVLPRLNSKYNAGNQFETHLQAYILQNLENTGIFGSSSIEWIGNEVSCGVGMQRIDIMVSVAATNRKIMPAELKSTSAKRETIAQLQRYVTWIEQYYIPNHPSDIEPIIIARETTNKTANEYREFVRALQEFNAKNCILPTRYVEFTVQQHQIIFNQVSY